MTIVPKVAHIGNTGKNAGVAKVDPGKRKPRRNRRDRLELVRGCRVAESLTLKHDKTHDRA